MSLLKSVGVSAKYLIFIFCNVVAALAPGWMPTYYLVGALLNAVLAKVLKRVINQPRPEKSPRPGRGMPSSHASAMTYFVVILAAKLPDYFPPLIATGIAAAVGIYVVLASYWRIVAHLHTAGQTVVGAVVGAAFAYMWTLFERELLVPPGDRNCISVVGFLGSYYTDLNGPPVSIRALILTYSALIVYYQKNHKKTD